MQRFSLLLFVLLTLFSGVTFADPRVDVAKAFVTNIHTGQSMRPEQWLTKESRTQEAFVAFGGLDAMVRQTTARADRFGGLKSVEVLRASSKGPALLVKIKVRFNRD